MFSVLLFLSALSPCLSASPGQPLDVAERELWNLVRSDFALAAQTAAAPLGDLSSRLPLPAVSSVPTIDGALDDTAWGVATEVPLPCVRARGPGRVVGNARYGEPWPLSETVFISSGRPPGCERFGVYLADFRGNCVLLYEDDTLDALTPIPLAPRPVPAVIPSRADYPANTALVFLLDVYRGPAMAGVGRGEVKALRIADFDVRDTPETGGLRQEVGPSGGHSCPVTALGGSWHVKRIIGTVPVYEDGSAFFRIPAERRVYFQPLDGRGMALQSMRSWLEAAPGEKVGCAGCHEPMTGAPPNRRVIAIERGPVDPTPWRGPPREFGFRLELQPVLDRHCVLCHDDTHPRGLDLRGDLTNCFSISYENLRPFVRPLGPQGPAGLLPVRSAGAVASPLVAMLLGGHKDHLLDEESLDRIVTWIDLNIPYYDNTALTRPRGAHGNNSGRAIVDDGKPLWDALGDRCASCHAGGFSLDPVTPPVQVDDLPKTLMRPRINLTHPAQSRILTAPLARVAGGLGLCSREVFASREDPAYRAALRVIEGWQADLATHPREDLPGSIPCGAYYSTQAKRAAWWSVEAENRRALAVLESEGRDK